jgi:DNA uptake protein ComE-like DNA-binding protein
MPTPVYLPLSERLDVNTVSGDEISRRCGIDPMTADRLVRGRPYASFDDVRTKMGLSRELSEPLSRCVKVVPPSR